MTENHIQENKIWRLIRNLSIILIIVALLIFSILLVSGKIAKLGKRGILPIKENNDQFHNSSVSLYDFDYFVNNKTELLELQERRTTMSENTTELSDIQKIESIAQSISKSHKYKLNEFDCTDFTKSLVGNLTKEGYNARCIIGYKKQNPKQVFHAWTEVNLSKKVEGWNVPENLSGEICGWATEKDKFCRGYVSDEIIWIESTTGEIVTEENKPYYKPLKGYKKYQCW